MGLQEIIIGAIGAAALYLLQRFNVAPSPAPVTPKPDATDAELTAVHAYLIKAKAGEVKLDAYDKAVLSQIKPLIDELVK
jgi:hypothetical protein